MSTYVGVDIAKASCSVCFGPQGEVGTYRMDASGHRKMVSKIGALEAPHVVMEATGGYEQALLVELVKAGFAVSVLNPRQARDFARALGQLAKTDAIDARILAQFGERLGPKDNGAERLRYEPVRRLAARRRQLVQMQVQEKNRLEHADAFLRKSIRAMLRHIERQCKLIDQEIECAFQERPQLEERRKRMCTVPGIAHKTATQLLAFLPELGETNRREIAALSGLAPRNRDSGAHRGKRMIGGGRSAVRHVLFMPTLVAIQHNPVIRRFYNRLLDQGKSKMTAVTAAMRKLLTILNTIIQKKEVWNPKLDIG